MKILYALLLASFLPAPSTTIARENIYDTIARLLMPFIQVVAQESSSPNCAVALSVRLESMTNLPPEFIGATAELALEAPDKLRVRAPIFGEELTLYRRGQKLWVSPGERAAAILALAEREGKLPREDKKFRLAPFELPFPEKQLVFLPALLQVQAAGEEVVDGAPCRVIDLKLMPELARSLGVEGWSARVWVSKEDRLTRLRVARADWQIQVRVESLRFSPSLPAQTWQPTEGQDALEISPTRYKQLLDSISGGGKKEKKKK
ncbi:MAG TPA: hypothetical protein VF614_03515 [Chthoniobacteraceae bacterium]